MTTTNATSILFVDSWQNEWDIDMSHEAHKAYQRGELTFEEVPLPSPVGVKAVPDKYEGEVTVSLRRQGY